MITKVPKLTLVGAGPGDPELITLKGIRSLRSADIILYDALIHPSLLDYSCTPYKIFVGKRAGRHEKSQDQINRLIVDYAYNYGHVVRLKGGDPFVFGRGWEEIEFAEKNGIPTEVVPGISSSISVPELARIPVTCRGESESFWVMSATGKDGAFRKELAFAARTSATIIILMGTRYLELISELFVLEGKPHLPVAIIENGSLKEEKILTGEIGFLPDQLKYGIKRPAVIVIGEVVRHSFSFQSITDKILDHERTGA